MRFTRAWAIPSADTFDCPPIGEFVKSYLRHSKVSVDPFARNKRWATYTNDLDPSSAAEYHLDALDFLALMCDHGLRADLVIFDPPYSPRQVKECYNGIGLTMTQEDGWRTASWAKEKCLCDELLLPSGVFLYFGWDSVGMGKNRPYAIEEVLLVCHGPQHNDTICLAERKIASQPTLFEEDK